MTLPTLAFSYPRRGLSGNFNTFRLGARAGEKYPVGTVVELVDARSKKPLKRATVTAVHQGTLVEMALLHADFAHNWKDAPAAERVQSLVASMKKRYPPGRALDTSICSVIYMKEIDEPA